DFFVRSGWSPRLYRRFTRGELDGAVLLMPPAWAPDVPYQGTAVRTEKLIVIGPRLPRDRVRRRLTAAELEAGHWILNPDGCGFRAALAAVLAQSRRRLHVKFEVDAAPQEHLAMVAAGIGFSIVPESALRHNPRLAAGVQELSVPDFDPRLKVWVIWSDQCRTIAGTSEALAEIFSERSGRQSRVSTTDVSR
ncbi:MAG TPA: substrate-binding domain-containing protein, partial [Vicinamibacterales bacterium]|nr:substrate-binding domain-containing protein [Vicinamibacterales bacterium]